MEFGVTTVLNNNTKRFVDSRDKLWGGFPKQWNALYQEKEKDKLIKRETCIDKIALSAILCCPAHLAGYPLQYRRASRCSQASWWEHQP